MTDIHSDRGRVRAQRHLVRHLSGEGVELGPGHSPLPLVHVGASARYVDRWEPGENRDLFPELGDSADGFQEPDFVCNLDVDRLSALPDASQDFVIASHVLEHLAEPLGMLEDIERVLKPGGHVLILLPDRRRTFDQHRAPTTWAHLLEEHRQGVTEVDDAHIADLLVGTGEDISGLGPAAQNGLFDLHRRRSVHVHVWCEDGWAEVVAGCISELGQAWALVDVLNNRTCQGASSSAWCCARTPRS